jgi:hypothetical protein
VVAVERQGDATGHYKTYKVSKTIISTRIQVHRLEYGQESSSRDYRSGHYFPPR